MKHPAMREQPKRVIDPGEEDNFLSDDEQRMLESLKHSQGGQALLKFIQIRQNYYLEKFIGTQPEKIAEIAALQAKIHSYREIHDLIMSTEATKEQEEQKAEVHVELRELEI